MCCGCDFEEEKGLNTNKLLQFLSIYSIIKT
nr:MAG TPA: hypothetical protein [Bacteriophage sp.]